MENDKPRRVYTVTNEQLRVGVRAESALVAMETGKHVDMKGRDALGVLPVGSRVCWRVVCVR